MKKQKDKQSNADFHQVIDQPLHLLFLKEDLYYLLADLEENQHKIMDKIGIISGAPASNDDSSSRFDAIE